MAVLACTLALEMTVPVLPRVFGQCVMLAALPADAATTNKPVWIHVATEGLYRGHPDWDVVDFTRPVFEKVIENFRAHPQYLAGSDGYGLRKVVPYDYEHASEMPATSGTIPQSGAPAPAWVLDLELRDGEDGKAKLWALTRLGKKARQQILDEEYAWTSVAVWPKGKHPVTGEDIGPVLTSIAFTNHPFIQGLEEAMAAANKSTVKAASDVWGKAESPEEAVLGLRKVFGTDPLAGADVLAEQMTRFAAFLQAGTVPVGIDVEWMLRRLRELFGLPTLATWQEIESAAGAFLGGLLSVGGQPLPDGSPEPSEPNAMSATLSSQIAPLLRCRDTDASILAAAKEAASATDALSRLQQLIGSSDVQSLLNDAAAMSTRVKELEGFVAALTDASKSLATGATKEPEDEELEEQAATAVAASLKVPDQFAPLLRAVVRLATSAVEERVLARSEVDQVVAGVADVEHGKRLRPVLLSMRFSAIGDAAKLAKFRQDWPVPQQDQRSPLNRPVFAGAGGAQLSSGLTGGGAPQGAPPASQTAANGAPAHIVAMSGRNTTEKAIAYLSLKNPDFRKQAWDSQVRAAGQYIESGAPPL